MRDFTPHRTSESFCEFNFSVVIKILTRFTSLPLRLRRCRPLSVSLRELKPAITHSGWCKSFHKVAHVLQD